MKVKTVIASVSIVVMLLVVSISAFGVFHLFSPKKNPGKSVTMAVVIDKLFGWKFPVTKFPEAGSGDQIAYSSIRDPGGIPQGLPMRLKIPIIGVDSAIEDALITADGRMDVPVGSENVAWFALGPQPGQVGSAVIGGHYGINLNRPFVFYKLNKVVVGDKIYVVNDKGETLGFVVRSIKLFDRNADATTVFTSQDGLAHLNLITCEGIWNQVNGTYPLRLVVFTDALPTTVLSATDMQKINVATFNQSLSVGSKGADVVALQTILVKKGFLTIPSGVSMGFFGVLTRAGVIKYQTSVGLPMVGIFGPLTRTKLNLELTSIN